MQTCKIYLSGAMSGLSFDDRNEWRREIEKKVRSYDLDVSPLFFNPALYYSYEEENYDSEKEIFEFDLNQLRKSDLIVANFMNPKSIGTAMELMLAKELRIPIVGLNENLFDLHPWLIECTTKIYDNIDDLVNYIVDFYLT